MSKVISVCGLKNSGKTTLINKLVRAYTERPVSNPEGRFLIVSDLTEKSFCEDTVHPDDIGSVISIIDSI
jgi:molybdopterin-guanine dinucleotide biosynthesis protein